MRVSNDDITFDSTDLSSDATSQPISIEHILNYAIQLVFTGTPNGSFKLQASCDEGDPNAPQESERDDNISNWTDISGSSQSISAAGSHLWTVADAGYKWVRVVWTVSSSSGTLTSARFQSKGL